MTFRNSAARGSRLATGECEKRLRPERGAGLPAEARARLRQGYGAQPSLTIRAKVGGECAEGAPPSESAWGCPPSPRLWRGLAVARIASTRAEAEGPTRSDKCMQSRIKVLVLAGVCLASLTGCRQDMHNQPKYRGLRASTFFADGSSARPLVEGTVARGTLQEDEAFFTGKIDKATVKDLPFAVDEALLNRGQERFNIYCTPCHGKTGTGNGMAVQRGFRQPPSFHIDRLRQADAGYFFDVITNGFGVMPDYRVQVAPRDRWAIVAYIRALQLSQHAAAADVPGGDPTKVPQAGGGEQAPEKH
jgi:mono/diheme cytochrome c family protein